MDRASFPSRLVTGTLLRFQLPGLAGGVRCARADHGHGDSQQEQRQVPAHAARDARSAGCGSGLLGSGFGAGITGGAGAGSDWSARLGGGTRGGQDTGGSRDADPGLVGFGALKRRCVECSDSRPLVLYRCSHQNCAPSLLAPQSLAFTVFRSPPVSTPQDFYQPYNERLSHILGDPRYGGGCGRGGEGVKPIRRGRVGACM